MNAASEPLMSAEPSAPDSSAPDSSPRPVVWLSDDEATRRVLEGDLAAFEHIMRRYNQRIYRVVRSIVKDPEEAEDVMQEAYVSALAHLGDFAGRAQFSTWLTRIAVHEAFARIRRRHRHQPLDDMISDAHSAGQAIASPEKSACDGELRLILEDAIFALPEHFRTVFVLREIQQLSVAETAETLDITSETVKTRLHRARGLLRQGLAERVDSALPTVLEFLGARCDRIVDRVLRRIGVR